ncbi:leucine-rich repeat and guanylate kinase domain-containing protein-like isoform X2 [Tubulanus polymorphus]|uniref:leucine-rich repeat and guanylate kinase domain-containing protein-like isoform X2 n=1 Tax=Tubulanus polymorphus TaxID=672921 RepID=UPI003DA47046
MADSGMDSSLNLRDGYSTTSNVAQEGYDDAQYVMYETNVLNLDNDNDNVPLTSESHLQDDPASEISLPGRLANASSAASSASVNSNVLLDENDTGKPTKELSPAGILDEETIAQGLSNLGRSADGTQQVFLHLTIPGFNLKDLSILEEYIHLQRIEIPYNEISDLTSLGNIPFLLELDASNNKITKLLDFKAPRNLKEVDLSFNLIEEMADLSAHHYLMKLNVDNNNIQKIQGLQNCMRLKHLSLAHNQIEKIEGLDKLPVTYLNLRYNKIRKIEQMTSLRYIQTLNLSGNKIRSLKGLEDHPFLENIDLEFNEVIDIAEIQYVQDLPMLRNLNLLRNPIQELPDYRLAILFRVQKLTELDRHRVDVEEKVAAVNMFSPPMEVVAARDHIMHVVYSFLQPSKVLECTLPSIYTPYPVLVLVGPEGSGAKELSLKLVEEFPEYFGYSVTHTTRRPYPGETTDKEYHFLSLDDFEEIIKYGRFLYTYPYLGEWYGLTIDSMENVAKEGLASVVHMELEGVLTLKNSHFEPRYVLIMPLDKQVHERRLREMEIFSETEIDHTLKRSELYVKYNQENPGFFDMFVKSDDIAEAYTTLRRLVLNYLGIGTTSPEEEKPAQSEQTEQATVDSTAVIPPLSAYTLPKSWPRLPDSAPAGLSSLVTLPPGTGRGIVNRLKDDKVPRKMQ